MFLPVKMGELWPSCGRVVPSIGRVVPSIGRVVAELSEFLGELLGEIVKFRQLAQKRLGGHLCLGGRIVLTKSEIKIFCNIETRFPWKTRHIPTPKMFGGSNETIFLHFGGLRNTQNGEN